MGQGRGGTAQSDLAWAGLRCQTSAARFLQFIWLYAGATMAQCGCDPPPTFPHCRTCSTQDDTSSELQRGAPPDRGEELPASAFQGRGALARYLCVPPARGEPVPFVPGFDTGDVRGVRIPSCCVAFRGCRDRRL